jgi:hypothetical protein
VTATEKRAAPPSPNEALTGCRVMAMGCAGLFVGGTPLLNARSTAFKKMLSPTGVNVLRPVYIGIALGAEAPSRLPPAKYIR